MLADRYFLCGLFQTEYWLPSDEQVDKLLAEDAQRFLLFVLFHLSARNLVFGIHFFIRLNFYEFGESDRNVFLFGSLLISIQVLLAVPAFLGSLPLFEILALSLN